MGNNSNGINNFKNLRKLNNYTQEAVADYLHLSRSAYCQYELGKRRPDYSTIMELSKFYSVPMDVLMDDGQMTFEERTPASPASSSKLMSRLSSMYLSLSKGDQNRVNEFIEELYLSTTMKVDS